MQRGRRPRIEIPKALLEMQKKAEEALPKLVDDIEARVMGPLRKRSDMLFEEIAKKSEDLFEILKNAMKTPSELSLFTTCIAAIALHAGAGMIAEAERREPVVDLIKDGVKMGEDKMREMRENYEREQKEAEEDAQERKIMHTREVQAQKNREMYPNEFEGIKKELQRVINLEEIPDDFDIQSAVFYQDLFVGGFAREDLEAGKAPLARVIEEMRIFQEAFFQKNGRWPYTEELYNGVAGKYQGSQDDLQSSTFILINEGRGSCTARAGLDMVLMSAMHGVKAVDSYFDMTFYASWRSPIDKKRHRSHVELRAMPQQGQEMVSVFGSRFSFSRPAKESLKNAPVTYYVNAFAGALGLGGNGGGEVLENDQLFPGTSATLPKPRSLNYYDADERQELFESITSRDFDPFNQEQSPNSEDGRIEARLKQEKELQAELARIVGEMKVVAEERVLSQDERSILAKKTEDLKTPEEHESYAQAQRHFNQIITDFVYNDEEYQRIATELRSLIQQDLTISNGDIFRNSIERQRLEEERKRITAEYNTFLESHGVDTKKFSFIDWKRGIFYFPFQEKDGEFIDSEDAGVREDIDKYIANANEILKRPFIKKSLFLDEEMLKKYFKRYRGLAWFATVTFIPGDTDFLEEWKKNGGDYIEFIDASLLEQAAERGIGKHLSLALPSYFKEDIERIKYLQKKFPESSFFQRYPYGSQAIFSEEFAVDLIEKCKMKNISIYARKFTGEVDISGSKSDIYDEIFLSALFPIDENDQKRWLYKEREISADFPPFTLRLAENAYFFLKIQTTQPVYIKIPPNAKNLIIEFNSSAGREVTPEIFLQGEGNQCLEDLTLRSGYFKPYGDFLGAKRILPRIDACIKNIHLNDFQIDNVEPGTPIHKELQRFFSQLQEKNTEVKIFLPNINQYTTTEYFKKVQKLFPGVDFELE